MNQRHNSPLFVLGACFLLSVLYCPLFKILFTDTEVFRYMGLALSKGSVPYRDFFDHKPPLIYFFNYAGILLGGDWGFWGISTALALVATWSFFQCCRLYRLPYPWLLPLLFNLMLRDFFMSSNNGTRDFTSIFFLLFFCTLIGKARFRDFLLGLLAGLVFFMQQEQVLSLIPFIAYTLLNKEAAPIGLRILRMVAGFLAVLLPILLYFAWSHSLTWFWQDAFLFNFSWYFSEKKTFLQHFSTVRRVLSVGNYEIPLIVSVLAGLLSLFFKHKKKGLIVTALAALAFTLVPEFMGGRYKGTDEPTDFNHYFLPMSAAICILLFVTTAFDEDDFLSKRKQRLFYAILLCSNLVFATLQYATHLPRWNKIPIVASPEANYLRQQRPGDYQLYVIMDNDYIYIYNELGILAPSRWIYHHFWWWYPNWDADQTILHSIGDDLLRHRTGYVIFDLKKLDRFRNPKSAGWLLSFMNTYYERVSLPGDPDPILWKRKGLAAY